MLLRPLLDRRDDGLASPDLRRTLSRVGAVGADAETGCMEDFPL